MFHNCFTIFLHNSGYSFIFVPQTNQPTLLMATFSIEVRSNYERKDGKYPVYIRITHNRQLGRIATGIYVTRQQLKRDLATIKDSSVVRELHNTIADYEKILVKLVGANMQRYSAKELAHKIEKYITAPTINTIDFGQFCQEYIQALKDNGHQGVAYKREAAYRNFASYYGSDNIPIKEVNVRNLQGFISYLSRPHQVKVKSGSGDVYDKINEPCKKQTIKDYMSALHTIFSACCEKYNDNDEEETIITHNPFTNKKVQLDVKEQPKKRDMTIGDLVKILTLKDLPTKRMELARDVLAISFYLLAMNTADIYSDDAKIDIRRVVYHRQKTASRRKDEALFSVKIEPEVLPLLRKYRDKKKKRLFKFYTLYSNAANFNRAVNAGCEALAKHLELPFKLTSYYIRHTWATLASEECGCSDEEVALALNHVSAEGDIRSGNRLRVTRGYIHRKFKKNDVNHRKVLDLVASKVSGNIVPPIGTLRH